MFACRTRSAIATVPLALLLLLPAPPSAEAQPPPWAPAHGYRAKQGLPPASRAAPTPRAQAPATFGLEQGRCDRVRLGEILAEAVGDAVGAGGGGPIAPELAGAVVGILVDGTIGRRMDPIDHACLARSLADADDGEAVVWQNPDEGIGYRVEPLASGPGPLQRPCRVLRVEMLGRGGVTAEETVTACRDGEGVWRRL